MDSWWRVSPCAVNHRTGHAGTMRPSRTEHDSHARIVRSLPHVGRTAPLGWYQPLAATRQGIILPAAAICLPLQRLLSDTARGFLTPPAIPDVPFSPAHLFRLSHSPSLRRAPSSGLTLFLLQALTGTRDIAVATSRLAVGRHFSLFATRHSYIKTWRALS